MKKFFEGLTLVIVVLFAIGLFAGGCMLFETSVAQSDEIIGGLADSQDILNYVYWQVKGIASGEFALGGIILLTWTAIVCNYSMLCGMQKKIEEIKENTKIFKNIKLEDKKSEEE